MRTWPGWTYFFSISGKVSETNFEQKGHWKSENSRTTTRACGWPLAGTPASEIGAVGNGASSRCGFGALPNWSRATNPRTTRHVRTERTVDPRSSMVRHVCRDLELSIDCPLSFVGP